MHPSGHGQAFDVDNIERQISELWRQAASEDQALMRACMLNLVVPCAGSEAWNEVSQAIAALSEHHPSRALVVAAEPQEPGPGELLAYVSAHCHLGPGGRQVCSEQVTLHGRGKAVELVPETVLQLLCEDLPVYLWWRRPQLVGDVLLEPLTRLSDRFVLDTTSFAVPGLALINLASIIADRSWRGSASDLGWVRLEPWRETVASLFDPPQTRAFLDHLTSVTVVAGGPAASDGLTVAGAYLAGWLASCLGWKPAGPRVWRRADGGQVRIHLVRDAELGCGEVGSVRIQASPDGESVATFVAERLGRTQNLVRVCVEMEQPCPPPRVLMLSGRDVVALLCEAIDRRARDPVFEAALALAAGLSPFTKNNPVPES